MSLESLTAPTDETARARVVLYALPTCGTCVHARALLKRRGIAFAEVPLQDLPGGRETLLALTGRLTVPQVVIDGEPIGGADALAHRDRQGALTGLVRREPFPRAIVRRRLSFFRMFAVLAPLIGGRRREPWRYEVVLLDRGGRALERRHTSTAESATQMADAFNSR